MDVRGNRELGIATELGVPIALKNIGVSSLYWRGFGFCFHHQGTYALI